MSAGYMRRCAGKKRHETRTAADGHRTELCVKERISEKKVDVYRCDQCLGWHIGGSANHLISRKRRSGKRPNKRLRGRV